MKKGDEVWVFRDWPIECLKDVRLMFKREFFDGWFDFAKKDVILYCAYDGGYQFSSKDIFPSEKAAKLANAYCVSKRINERLSFVNKEIKALEKEKETWRNLAFFQ